jgi:uncharacterized membrane protein
MHFPRLRIFRFILLVLTVPLLFINIKSTHDWGDDFAQYLIQARNIVEHRPQTDNGLLLDEQNANFAVKAYPIGFPLLIAPVYALKGFEVRYYLMLNSVLLVITSFFCFEFFRKRTTLFISLLITLVFCYNIHILEIKKTILSEISFTCLLMGILLWNDSARRTKIHQWIITGILISYLISIRIIGISMLTAIVLYEIIFNKKELLKRRIIKAFGISILSTLVFVMLNIFIFPTQSFSLLGFYSNAVSKFGIPFLQNLNLNYDVARYIFPFFDSWITPVWIVIAFAGWILRIMKSPQLSEVFFIIYVLVLLSYPYSDGGNRFLLPVLPLLLYYSGYFFELILKPAGKYSIWIVSGLYIFMLVLCIQPLTNILQSEDQVEQGPYTHTSRELIAFINSTPSNSVVAFCKPRVIALYTGHPSIWM